MSDDAIDQASAEYDRAEQAYITALASGAEDATLRTLAKQVAQAAKAWESTDNAAVAPPAGITSSTTFPKLFRPYGVTSRTPTTCVAGSRAAGPSGERPDLGRITGNPVRVEVTPTSVEDVEPARAVAAIVMSGPDSLGAIRQAVCSQQNFYRDAEVAAEWLAANPNGLLLPMADAFEVFRRVFQRILPAEFLS